MNSLVSLLTEDTRLAQRMRELLEGEFHVDVRPGCRDASGALCQNAPRLLVADFRTAAGGGHLEDRFLEDIQVRLPQTRVVLLTTRQCPEPLARRAACTGLLHMSGEVDAVQLAGKIREMLATEPAAGSGSERDDEFSDFGERVGPVESVSHGFETKTPHLQAMLDDLDVAARHNVSILLIGETGSGKTYLARLIHEVSPRRSEPFLHVACGALPNELIESELFGHVKGAFTSAHADKEGKFVAAGSGTILLDEIDVLGPEQQVKLLRVIETGEFEPVGSNRTLKSQARLVVASNLDLQPLVEAGRFRPDLYYRLNMLKFEIPPLRLRGPDITPLARKFVRQLSQRHQVEIKRIDRSFFEALHAYPWPGNVRELENVIQRTVIFCRDGVLTAGQLPQHIISGAAGPVNDPSVSLKPAADNRSLLGRQIATTEQEIIEQALFRNNFSRTNTAKQLGISRVTLYNKMKKYGILKK